MMEFVDVTGKDDLVPACPVHPGVAMKQELVHLGTRDMFVGFRCPICQKVYREKPIV